MRAETNEEVGKNIHTILNMLGVQQVCVVSKLRETYKVGNILVCLDDVSDLGTFVELEILTEGGTLEASADIVDLIGKLGLDTFDFSRKSYYQMQMKRLGFDMSTYYTDLWRAVNGEPEKPKEPGYLTRLWRWFRG